MTAWHGITALYYIIYFPHGYTGVLTVQYCIGAIKAAVNTFLVLFLFFLWLLLVPVVLDFLLLLTSLDKFIFVYTSLLLHIK